MSNGDPANSSDWRIGKPWGADRHILYVLPGQGRATIGFLKDAALAGHIADLHNAALADASYPATPAPAAEPAEPAPAAPAAVDGQRASPQEIRAWAKQRGYVLSERGRIPGHIVEHFHEAHGGGQ
jgi:pyruvate/2-oxoglutarate dehydrogenase complex dihydrolipoamide acyltransferase (E2) component